MPDTIQEKTHYLQWVFGLLGFPLEGLEMELNGIEPSTS
jgi:hypothetical protein